MPDDLKERLLTPISWGKLSDAYYEGTIAWVDEERKEARDRIEALERLVERAFRDGIAYAGNVVVTDVDLAWEQSRVRAELRGEG